MALQLVPLTPSPNQNFPITLSVNGSTLSLRLALSYNAMAGYWQMDISDSLGNLLLSGIPLVTGAYPAGNLLQQFGHLGIGSAFLINASGDPNDYPGAGNLGTDYQIWWGDN